MLITRLNNNYFDNLLKDFYYEDKEYKRLKTNIIENEDSYTMELLVPGFNKEDINITLEDEYLSYKDMFTTKYGKPKHIEEKFKDKISREYNMEMYALYQNNCKFASSWELDNGYITVSIESFGTLKGCVVLQYEDSANSEKRSKNNLDDI